MEAEQTIYTRKDDPEILDLSSYSSSRSSSRGKDSGGGGFIVGIILIWIGIPLVWMNERRDAKTYKVIQKARRAVRRADAQNP